MTNSAHETSNKFLISAKSYAQLYKLGERNSGTSSVYTVDPDDSGAFEGTILYDTLKHKQQHSKFTRHNQFDANQRTLVKWCGFFFSNEKKWLHRSVLCWRKYEYIYSTLYVLHTTIRGRN